MVQCSLLKIEKARAPLSTRQTWTALQHDGPDHLGLWLTQEDFQRVLGKMAHTINWKDWAGEVDRRKTLVADIAYRKTLLKALEFINAHPRLVDGLDDDDDEVEEDDLVELLEPCAEVMAGLEEEAGHSVEQLAGELLDTLAGAMEHVSTGLGYNADGSRLPLAVRGVCNGSTPPPAGSGSSTPRLTSPALLVLVLIAPPPAASLTVSAFVCCPAPRRRFHADSTPTPQPVPTPSHPNIYRHRSSTSEH